MKSLIFLTVGLFLIFTGCKNDVVNNSNPAPVYNEILTVNLPDNYSLKLYTAGSDSLTYAYNDVFFKVWLNSAEQNTGYIKVYPKMRMTPHITHSAPLSDSFAYNSSLGYYSGYIVFNMQTVPPDLVWNTTFTYTGQNGVNHETDSVKLYTAYRTEKQLKYFYDLYDSANYTLTLVKPFYPAKGRNNLSLLLHRSTGLNLQFECIRTAAVHINVYKQDSLLPAPGSIDPVINADGYYNGAINIPYKGSWIVGDTIYYNGRKITNNPSPLPEFLMTIE